MSIECNNYLQRMQDDDVLRDPNGLYLIGDLKQAFIRTCSSHIPNAIQGSIPDEIVQKK